MRKQLGLGEGGGANDGNAERREGEPEITIEFFFSPHLTAKDLVGLQERFNLCDVYVSEAAEFKPEEVLLADQIAKGKYRPDALDVPPERRTALQQENAMLFDSKKALVFIDIPEGNKLHVHSVKFRQQLLVASKAFCYQNFYQALDHAKMAIAENAKYIGGRDDYMADKLSKINLAIAKHPELKNKDKIRVLVVLGSAHADLPNKIDSRFRVESSSSGKSDLLDELTIKKIRNQEFSDELVAKALFEAILRQVMHREFLLINNSVFELKFARALMKHFSLAQIRDISKRTAWEMNVGDGTKNGIPVLEVLRKLVEEIGKIDLPKSDDEFGKFEASVIAVKARLGIE